MKKIIKSVCIDCTEIKPIQVFGISTIVDILELHDRYITPSYDKDNGTLCLDINEDETLRMKRGCYLVLYDDKTKEVLTEMEYKEKMRAQNLNGYGLF